jgi:hypothetical protein
MTGKSVRAAFGSTIRIRGVSSAGRAPALQAGGHRFDPGTLQRERPWKQGLSVAGVSVRSDIEVPFGTILEHREDSGRSARRCPAIRNHRFWRSAGAGRSTRLRGSHWGATTVAF